MRALKVALAAAGLALLAAAPAAAHTGATSNSGFGWTLDPWMLAPLGLSGGLFLRGWRRLAPRAVHSRPGLNRRAWAFALGWSLLGLALVSPLHAAGEHSFTAHMVEHELLMLAAAPLLVLSEPLAIMVWSLPLAGRRALGRLARAWLSALWRRLTEPVTATLFQAAALWLWHAPALFDQALAHPAWHVVQHLCFLVSALVFWSAMLHRRPRNYGVAALCLFATSVVSGALGAMMAFAQSPWYAGYSRLGMAPLGLTALEDQQLAGMLMWVPGGVVHAGAALAAVAAALRPSRSGVAHGV